MVEENTTETAKKPRKARAARKRSATPAASRTSAAKLATVPVEYLIDYGEAKKGETGKLPVSEARRLGWRGIVRETNNDPKK